MEIINENKKKSFVFMFFKYMDKTFKRNVYYREEILDSHFETRKLNFRNTLEMILCPLKNILFSVAFNLK